MGFYCPAKVSIFREFFEYEYSNRYLPSNLLPIYSANRFTGDLLKHLYNLARIIKEIRGI